MRRKCWKQVSISRGWHVYRAAAEDADAEAIMAEMLAEAEKARAVGAEPPTLQEFIQMLAA